MLVHPNKKLEYLAIYIALLYYVEESLFLNDFLCYREEAETEFKCCDLW